jgi:hypothetical protein
MREVLVFLCFQLVFSVNSLGTIPPEAKSDPRYDLGYLVVTYYPGVDPTGTTDSRAGIQSAIDDAFKMNMALLFPEGTYLVSDALKCYVWQIWDVVTTRNRPITPPRLHHVLLGSETGTSRPIIKLMPNAVGFDDPENPRPVLVYRNFFALNNSGVPPLIDPADPLFGIPDNYKELDANLFGEAIRSIDFDLSSNTGAIGLAMRAAQRSSIVNVSVDATDAYCGFYGIPGRNMGAANIEVIGGQYGVFARGTAGSVVVGARLINQTKSAIYNEDFVSLSVVGFHIVNNAAPSIYTTASSWSSAVGNLSLVDGIIEMQSGGLAISNANGKNIYLENIFVKGADQLVKSKGMSSIIGSGEWQHIVEYAYNDQTLPNGDPPYENRDNIFRTYSVIDGEISRTPEPLLKIEELAPSVDFIQKHLWDDLPSYEGQEDGTAVVTDAAYGATPNDTSDDWAAITKAIEETPNGKVFIPKGTYILRRPLELKSDTKFFGVGRSISNLITDGTWTGGQDGYILETPDDPDGDAYIGFFTIEYGPTGSGSFNAGCIDWKVGEESVICAVQEVKKWGTYESSNPRIMVRYSGSAGGKS